MVLLGALLSAEGAGGRVLADDDLARISLGPKDAEARALMARKAWGQAAARVTADAPGPRLVRGWLLVQAGDPAGALKALDGAPEALPALADLARTLRAEALLATKRPADAAREAAAVSPESAHAKAALRLRARALREAGRAPDARAAYNAIIGSGDPEEVPVGLVGLARLEVEAGRPERAIPLLRRADTEFPLHWAAETARREAEALIGPRPALKSAWADRPPGEVLDRAGKLLEAHRNEEAAEAVAPLAALALDDAARCEQQYIQGRALRKLRQWKQARPLLDAAVAVCAKARHEVLPWAVYLAAAAAERLGDEGAAADLYRRLFEEHRDHRLGDDGGYFLVKHLLDDAADPAAARALAKRMASERPEGDMVPEAVFTVALHDLLRGDRAAAREMVELEATLPGDPKEAGRAGYWRARIDLDEGRREAAADGFRAVLATYPLTWYALLSYGRLREIDADAARKTARKLLDTVETPPSLPSATGDPWRLAVPAAIPEAALERVLLLVRLGLTEPAWQELQAAGLSKTTDDEVRWFAAWMLDRTGVYHLSHDILRRELSVFRRFAPAGPLKKHWRLAFPRPFEAQVDAAVKETGVDRAFLWAIMREESGFNPAAESFANAQGLMQLMVPTAKRMAKKDDGPIDRAALADPALNLRLAARYMKLIRSETNAPYALVPAAYNAGEGALKRWLRERPDVPLDLFVEAIPFEETRWYVKRVVSSWAVYRTLYGKDEKDPLPYLSQKKR